eukprot:TRINITY_DN3660_c0_g1_i2.p1 TRINITY_DN3660_c0_g1~~TRINITY_DN3660_c0_g1_i2.p1  ORF type:complete len:165 (+),score=31.29 TRINITY_DN3660_c0_g1_i2:137-631(+)
MDLQAQDRCHRIGQTKPVCVYRLICSNSIDSKIFSRASSRLRLERLVIHKEGFSGKSSKILTNEDVAQILQSETVKVFGGEKPVSDAELFKLLDREKVMKMFEEHEARAKDEEKKEDEPKEENGGTDAGEGQTKSQSTPKKGTGKTEEQKGRTSKRNKRTLPTC